MVVHNREFAYFALTISKTMDSQYSESLVSDDNSESLMESHAEDYSSITTEERDKISSEEEQSSVTTENSSDEEIDPLRRLPFIYSLCLQFTLYFSVIAVINVCFINVRFIFVSVYYKYTACLST